VPTRYRSVFGQLPVRGLGRFWDDLNLEEFWPQLARDEQAVVLGIPCDAIQDGFRAGALGVGEQAGQVDEAENLSGGGRDPRNAVRVPDVGVNLAVYVFELVQLVDRFAVV